MNNFVASKNNQPAGRKQGKQRVSKKYKEPRKRRTRVKEVLKRGQDLENCAENECSIGEIYNTSGRVYKTSSDDSVIYVGHYFPDKKNIHIPFIDLTNSTENLPVNGKSDPVRLKTLYFPERNFIRSGRLCKFLKTTSLVTLPVGRKPELPAKPHSFTDLNTSSAPFKNKLSILGLPDTLLDAPYSMVSPEVLEEKTKLTMSDYEMINWIIENDHQVHSMDDTGVSSTLGYNSSIDTGMSIEELVKVYDVSNESRFE